MREQQILALAEARANGNTAPGEGPTEADFEQAEREVREMVADGATYDNELGWVWPS